MKNILFTIIAAVVTTPALAASVRYEFRPDSFEVDEIIVWDTNGQAMTTACEDPSVTQSYPICTESFDISQVAFGKELPHITFDTALMPFDLPGHRVLLNSFGFYPELVLSVFDVDGNLIIDKRLSNWQDISNFEVDWIPSFSAVIPFTVIDMKFDQAGAVSEWDILLDYDGGEAVGYSNNSATVRTTILRWESSFYEVRMSNDGGGQWLINGVPQEEFLSPGTAVPLPASVLLLFGGLTALGGLRASRRLSRS